MSDGPMELLRTSAIKAFEAIMAESLQAGLASIFLELPEWSQARRSIELKKALGKARAVLDNYEEEHSFPM